ncbi:hypothetical protein [Spirosoma endophyticum]|uniref:DUF3828 domain-containing protein n=1 Tax=Spirosoma endophyticum TaxID=662367 RepID=A0A1I2C4C2_9BACT|nr:hypothetical protein [Spirosoma endophyticum]SFE63038.1 hypothetical protein SAMN05216167_116102 [Spirosoma endophyticum]
MKTSYLFLVLTAIGLSCQTKPKQETATTSIATEDSASALAKRPGPDTPRSAADRLVRALYFEHNKKENPFQEKKDRTLVDQFFAKPTADLIWSDALKSAGKVNRSKINLLFNAPDAAVKKTWVLPAIVGGSRAIVYVTFENKGKVEEVRIDMQQISGRWRITEMVYPDGKRLTQLLQ